MNSADQSGAVPFLDIGNRYVLAGAQYNPQVLAGLSAAQIAAQLRNPSSPVAQAIDGSARGSSRPSTRSCTTGPARASGRPGRSCSVRWQAECHGVQQMGDGHDRSGVARTLSARYYKDGSEILINRG